MTQQVCPWCQMEITWDEDLGPETSCPHCYNELSEYRTMTIPVKRDASAIPFDEESDDDWNRYTRAAEQYLDAQEEAMECPQCQEYMVHAGEQFVTEQYFQPKPSMAELGGPFLKAPFRMDVYVCSHCFTIHQRLSGKDRLAIVRRLGGREEE
jgi:Zn finger protein HypA/HybF involved in hydrogenase expression